MVIAVAEQLALMRATSIHDRVVAQQEQSALVTLCSRTPIQAMPNIIA